MRLHRTTSPRSVISLVSMVDVLMIMLVFFMVTSTYLDLAMVPLAERGEAPADDAPAPDAPGQADATAARAVLIRLDASGTYVVGGLRHTPETLGDLIGARISADPDAQILVLPSGAASTQALVSLMEVATRAGAVSLRIIRLEARP